MTSIPQDEDCMLDVELSQHMLYSISNQPIMAWTAPGPWHRSYSGKH